MPETLNLSLRGGEFESEVLKGGSGPSLLYLHGAIGQKGWAPFLDALAQKFTVYAPYMPGYSKSGGLANLDDGTGLSLIHTWRGRSRVRRSARGWQAPERQ